MPQTPHVVIERRSATDLPALVQVLSAQQSSSRYPLRWPLPFPVEDFLVRSHEDTAWVARLDGRVVGHVSVGRVEGAAAEPFTAATGRPAHELALVSVLFVALDVLGSGIGGRLLDTAVEWARQRSRLPVLDVVPGHAAAVDVYRHRGWAVIGELRPLWLPADQESLLIMSLPVEAELGTPEP